MTYHFTLKGNTYVKFKLKNRPSNKISQKHHTRTPRTVSIRVFDRGSTLLVFMLYFHWFVHAFLEVTLPILSMLTHVSINNSLLNPFRFHRRVLLFAKTFFRDLLPINWFATSNVHDQAFSKSVLLKHLHDNDDSG